MFSIFHRFEDLTDPEVIRQNPKADRTICLYGYMRGAHLRYDSKVHIMGEWFFRQITKCARLQVRGTGSPTRMPYVVSSPSYLCKISIYLQGSSPISSPSSNLVAWRFRSYQRCGVITVKLLPESVLIGFFCNTYVQNLTFYHFLT